MAEMSQRAGVKRLILILVTLFLSCGAWFAQAQDAPAQGTEPDSGLQVELGFGSGIDRETRSLVGESAVFPVGQDRVFCRMHILGAQAPTTVTHAWFWEGKTMAQVELNVGSANWRTWSSKRLLASWAGNWEVKVLDQEGKVLASAGFQVQ